MSEPTLRRSDQINDIAAALAAAQLKFKPAEKKRTANVKMKAGGDYSYKYADLADVIDAIRPALSEHGLSFVQSSATIAEGAAVAITTLLLHSSGQWFESVLCMPLGDNRPQTLGSIITYGRRYALTCMVGIATEEDDDGRQAQEAAESAREDRRQRGSEDQRQRPQQQQQQKRPPAAAPAAANGADPSVYIRSPKQEKELHAHLEKRNVETEIWAAIDKQLFGKRITELATIVPAERAKFHAHVEERRRAVEAAERQAGDGDGGFDDVPYLTYGAPNGD